MSFNPFDPNEIFPYAESVSNFGTCVSAQGGNGFGLLTRGLLWQAYDIWFDVDAHDGITTSWTSSNASITTTWTLCGGGVYGEIPAGI